MILLITGPQASGKGTQADLLEERLGMVHISTGALLRKLAGQKTPVGKKVDRIIHQKGTLVPEKIVTPLVEKVLTGKNLKKGLVFDGYPRRRIQVRIFERLLKKRGLVIDRVFYIAVSEKEIKARLAGRLICPKCGENYHVTKNPPRQKGICDRCQVRLVKREDEKPTVIKTRLKIYQKQTAPLLAIYKKRRILEEVDGERPIETIYQDIVARLKKAGLAK